MTPPHALGLSLLALTLAALASCAPPIECPDRHHAREEVLCPPCADDGGDCPCTRGWVCREDPEVGQERTRRVQAQIRREKEQAAREEAAREEAARLKAAREEAARSESPPDPPPAPPAEPPRPHLLPAQTPAECAEPCPGGATRIMRLACVEEPGRARVKLMERCPTPLRYEGGCAVPWTITSICDAPPAPPRPPVVCRARAGQCCLEDGTVVVPCGPGPAREGCQGGACGSGGFCQGCR